MSDATPAAKSDSLRNPDLVGLWFGGAALAVVGGVLLGVGTTHATHKDLALIVGWIAAAIGSILLQVAVVATAVDLALRMQEFRASKVGS